MQTPKWMPEPFPMPGQVWMCDDMPMVVEQVAAGGVVLYQDKCGRGSCHITQWYKFSKFFARNVAAAIWKAAR